MYINQDMEYRVSNKTIQSMIAGTTEKYEINTKQWVSLATCSNIHKTDFKSTTTYAQTGLVKSLQVRDATFATEKG